MLSAGLKWIFIIYYQGYFTSQSTNLNSSANFILKEDSISTTSSVISTTMDINSYHCNKVYNSPDPKSCPPLPEDGDLFHLLHNNTDPRPTNNEEFQLTIDQCTARILCCGKGWNWTRGRVMGTFASCFCMYWNYCDGFNVTEDHRLYQKYMKKAASDYMISIELDSAIQGILDNLPVKITLFALYGIVWIWGLTGNILVVITVFRFMKRESVTNVFIANLSFGDILVVGFALPFRFVHKVMSIWMWDDWLCKSIWLVFYTSLMVSSFTMTAMSIERYLAICHPMKAKYVSTLVRAKRIIAVIWVVAISLSAVAASFFNGGMSQDTCVLPQIHRGNLHLETKVMSSITILFYILIVAFIIPLMIMIVAYINVGISLHKSVKEARVMRGDISGDCLDKLNSKDNDLKGRIQVVKMLVAVLILFVVTWLPNLVMDILYYTKIVKKTHYFGDTRVDIDDIMSVLVLLTFINSCLNPVFYALYSKSFREGITKCFSCCLRHKKKTTTPNDVQPVQR